MLGRIALAVVMTTGVCSLASAAQPADPKPEIIDQAAAGAEGAEAAAPALAAAPTPRPRPAPAAVSLAQRGLDPAEFAARFAVAGLDEAAEAEPVAPAAAPAVAAVPLPRTAPVDRVSTASLSPAEPAAVVRAVPAVAVAAPVVATPAVATAPVATPLVTPAVAAPAELAALQPTPEPPAAQAAVAELAAAEPAAPAAAEPLPGVAAAAEAQREIGEVAGRSRLDQLIAAYADRHDVPEALVRRVVKRESNFNPSAYSAGNWGLMQIRHGTAKAMGYRGPAKGLLDAETNLAYAVKYLAGAYKVAGGNADRAIRLYASGYYYEAKRKGLLEETGLKGGGTVAAADPVPAQQIAGGMY